MIRRCDVFSTKQARSSPSEFWRLFASTATRHLRHYVRSCDRTADSLKKRRENGSSGDGSIGHRFGCFSLERCRSLHASLYLTSFPRNGLLAHPFPDGQEHPREGRELLRRIEQVACAAHRVAASGNASRVDG